VSDALYIRAYWTRAPAANAAGFIEWAIAEIVLNDEVIIRRAQDNQGAMAKEGVCMRSAISLAKNDFSMWLKDIRMEKPDGTKAPNPAAA
jgi:hypothetical protein